MNADDAMAICAAFNSPEVEIIGLTTTFGNVLTPTATANAFILLKLVGQEQACAYHFVPHLRAKSVRGACRKVCALRFPCSSEPLS